MSRWPESKRNADGKLALTWRIVDPVMALDVQRQFTADAFAAWTGEWSPFAFREWRSGDEPWDIGFSAVTPADLIFADPFAYAVRDGIPGSGLLPVTRFNPRYQWTAELYRHVCAHEIGHDLGRDDESADPADLMYAYTSPAQLAIITPQPNDIAWLRKNYNLPPLGAPTMPTQSAKLAFASPPPDSVKAGSKFQVSVNITNDGTVDWQPEDVTGWTVLKSIANKGRYALGDRRDEFARWGAARFAFPSVVHAGESINLTVDLLAPFELGVVSVMFQLVCEGDKWFGPELSKAVLVTPADQPVVPSGPPVMTINTIYQGQAYVGDVAWRKAL